MEESDAIRKFRTILKQFNVDEQVKEIDFCENKLAGALGAVEPFIEYRIALDKLLLTDPEKLESDWTAQMAQFPDDVLPSVPKDDRVFLIFLHEVGHIVNGHCLRDAPDEDSPEDREWEQEAWGFAWVVYRAYRAGHEQTD